MKIPVNLKILFVTVVALAVTISYLIKQSIIIQQQDKINLAYQSQLNETVLLGDKFLSLINNGLNSLKQIAALDWQKPETPLTSSSILKNQNEIKRIYLVEIPLNPDMDINPLYKSSNEFGDAEQKLVNHWVISKIDDLSKNNPVIVNLSGDQGQALVGIIIPDLNYDVENKKILALVAILNTSNLFSNLNYEVEVVNKQGQLIYSSDLKTLITKEYKNQPITAKAWGGQLSSAILEYEFEGIKQLGGYYKIPYDLLFVTTQPLIKITSSVYVTAQKMILIGIIALCIAILIAGSLAKSISRPIENLTEATKKIAEGNFKISIPKKSNDEIGTLASSFEIMSSKIENLLVSQKEKIRLENEMNIAATVQKTLFPAEQISLDQVDIFSHYSPAEECGGDLWGYFINKDKLYFIIADATGHGLPSALITVAAKSTLSLVKRMLEQNHEISPKEILSYANRSVFETSQGKIMMTCFVGQLNLTNGLLTYANAGHNPPWVFSSDSDKVSSLAMPGTRLGEAVEQVEFQEKTMVLKPGDKVFLYTDGIVENTNSKGEMFDKKRVRELVKTGLPQGPKKTLQNLLLEFNKFIGKKQSLDDDTTVVLIDVKKINSVVKVVA